MTPAVGLGPVCPSPTSTPGVELADALLLEEAVASFGAAALGGRLWVSGGHIGKAHQHSVRHATGSFRSLDFASGGPWTEHAPSRRLQGLALVAARGALVRIGGLEPRNEPGVDEDLHSIAEVARFDPATGSWEPLPSLPEPRSSHDAVVALGRHLVVAGGWSLAGADRRWHRHALVLDLADPDAGWRRIPQPFARRALALAARGPEVYAIGGMDDEGRTSRRVDVLDLEQGTWTPGPDLPEDGFGAAACSVEDRVLASARSGRVHALDRGAGAWSEFGRLAVPRFFHRFVPLPDGEVLVVGGAARGGHLRLIERLGPASDRSGPRLVRTRIPWPGAARNRQAAALLGSKLVLAGGNRSLAQHDFAPDRFVAETWALDLTTLGVEALPPLPAPRQSAAVLATGPSRFRLAGGFARPGEAPEHAIPEVLAFEAGPPSGWRAEAALPGPLTQAGAAVLEGRSFLLGGLDYDRSRGEDAFRHSDRIFVDEGDGAFREMALRLPEPRRAFGCAAHDGLLYVAGGLGDGFVPATDFLVIDPLEGRIDRLPAPAPRLGPELVALGDALFLVGGTPARRGEAVPFIERFDPRTRSWTTVVAEAPFEATHVRAAVWQDRLLLWSTHREEPVMDLAWIVCP
jgi:hypothetical protein